MPEKHEPPDVASGEPHYSWKPSRFNRLTTAHDGALVAYNSYMGALARFTGDEATTAATALNDGVEGLPKGVLAELALNGFLVPRALDEMRRAEDVHYQYQRGRDGGYLELILMPNENCNFRCDYCYESFKRNKMTRGVVEGIVRYAEKRMPNLAELVVGWFGGEPLTATEIVEEVSERLRGICAGHDVAYSSSMVTNGYLLDTEVASMLFRSEVRQFQITIDGPKEQHDRLRTLADRSSGTHERIYNNLLSLHERGDDFQVVVRVNFDQGSVDKIPTFIRQLEKDIGSDPRFFVDFHAVGRWGGPHDSRLETCSAAAGTDHRDRLFRTASKNGFDLKNLRQRLGPSGSVCYAANPSSFVVGSDGTIYKCTVAFEDPRNQVGYLTEEGELFVDERKLSLWVSGGEETDGECRTCFFRPSCQGNACPWGRIRTGERQCPSDKINIEETLRLLVAEAISQRQQHECSVVSIK